MAELPPLATPEEFATYLARENAVVEGDVDQGLNVVSNKVREAAKATISLLTSTITIVRPPDSDLLRLPGPVVSVTSIAAAGGIVPTYNVDVEGAWLSDGSSWASLGVITATGVAHGYSPVPADIIDLVCELTVEWLRHRAAGGGSVGGLQSVAIDDARESYTAESAGYVTPVFIPRATRDDLARRFGAYGAVVTGGSRR